MAKKKKKPEETEVDKPAESDNIQTVVANWVGEVPNLTKIDFRNVFGDRYRINVWTSENGSNRISKSFFVSISNNEIRSL